MPIIIKQPDWDQTERKVYLSLPLNGVSPKQVDVFRTKDYLKISFPPYLFESFWPHEVLEAEDEIKVDVSTPLQKISLELTKREERLWHNFSLDLSNEEKARKRLQVVDEYHSRWQSQDRSRLESRRTREREAVWKGLQQEEARREEIKARKEEAKRDFFNGRETSDKKGGRLSDVVDSKTVDKLTSSRAFSISLAAKVAREREALRHLPPPRQAVTINVAFSPSRIEKTRLLEDTDDTPVEGCKSVDTDLPGVPGEDENAVLTAPTDVAAKNTARAIVDGATLQTVDKPEGKRSSIDCASHDCDFILEKGLASFAEDDFASAIKMFTHGIKMYPKQAKFYNNRSACYLKVGNLRGALEDASKALDLLQPTTELNAKSRAKALTRRAAALVALDLSHEALDELREACRLLPDHQGLRDDIAKIESRVLAEP